MKVILGFLHTVSQLEESYFVTFCRLEVDFFVSVRNDLCPSSCDEGFVRKTRNRSVFKVQVVENG